MISTKFDSEEKDLLGHIFIFCRLSQYYDGSQLHGLHFNASCAASAVKFIKCHLSTRQRSFTYFASYTSPNIVFKEMTHSHSPPGHKTSHQYSTSLMLWKGNCSRSEILMK